MPTDPSVLFTWKIENFSKQKAEKLYSQIFYCGGFKWRLNAYPKGLSVYLDIPDSAKLPPGWSRYARFSISLINQIHTQDTKSKHTEHKFNAGESSWGFPSFLPLVKLNDPEEGFLVNDTIVLEASITIPNSHDSKKETGFEPEKKKRKQETGDNGSGNVEADITGTSTSPQKALLLLEKIHSLHEVTYVKFSMKALRLAANSIEDFEQVGLDLRWLKQRLEEAKGVKKHSDGHTVESCTSALEVARAKVRELEEGLAKAKAEGEVMSRELPKSLGVNDAVLKDIV
ncbi:hypothetical protein C3L33_20141, partial [Rhododendron williamsianum]